MTLPATPPHYDGWLDIVYPIMPGEKNSWRVWALQKDLQNLGRDYVVADGDYDEGKGTEKAVRDFQEKNDLLVDSIVGVITQQHLNKKIVLGVDEDFPELPKGINWGFCLKEASGLLAPVNEFDPSPSDLGADLGPAQWRVKGPPYDLELMKAAFNGKRAFRRAVIDEDKGFLPRFERITRLQPRLAYETRIRATILAHNAPFLYEQFCDFGRLTTPTKLATWTNKPGGGHYTHEEWYWNYSGDVIKLGNVQL